MTPAVYSEWRLYMDIGQMALTLGIGVYVWWTRREKVTNRRFETLEKDMAERVTKDALTDQIKELEKQRDERCKDHQGRTKIVETSLTRVETDVARLPTRGDLEILSQDINKLNGSLHEVSGRLSGINRAVDLMNEFLIQQGKKQ